MSYAHDSTAHAEQVTRLAELLVANDVDVDLDRWAGPLRRDWVTWAVTGMQRADFILVIASPGYRSAGDGWARSTESRGVTHDAAVIRDLVYTDRKWTSRILPVVLPSRSPDELPLFLQPSISDHHIVRELSQAGIETLLEAIRRPRNDQ
jgi:hypothetical protein